MTECLELDPVPKINYDLSKAVTMIQLLIKGEQTFVFHSLIQENEVLLRTAFLLRLNVAYQD